MYLCYSYGFVLMNFLLFNCLFTKYSVLLCRETFPFSLQLRLPLLSSSISVQLSRSLLSTISNFLFFLIVFRMLFFFSLIKNEASLLCYCPGGANMRSRSKLRFRLTLRNLHLQWKCTASVHSYQTH